MDMSGYKLLKTADGNYQLKSSTTTFTGSASQVRTYAILEHGFDGEEIDLGMQVMDSQLHNAAEYGVFKSFMFSKYQEETRETYSIVH